MVVLGVSTSAFGRTALNRTECPTAPVTVRASTLAAMAITMSLHSHCVLCCLCFVHRQKRDAANTHYSNTNCKHCFLHLLMP